MRIDEAQLLARAFTHAGKAMLVADRSGRILAVNAAFERATGWSPGQSVHQLWPGDGAMANVLASVTSAGQWQGALPCRHANGETVVHDTTVTVVRMADGKPAELVVVMSDPGRHNLLVDSLTGLPDRSVFMEQLKTTCAQVERKRTAAAVLFLDLDNFKYVNDTLGHDAGDRLLKEAARRLKACVRESDTVCRLGGDEFTVILSGLNLAEEAELVAQHILCRLAHPFDIGGSISPMSASIGIAVLPNDGIDPTDLLKRADTAMYQAKRSGRATYAFYSQEMTARAAERLQAERELRQAFDSGDIHLRFRPIVAVNGARVAGSRAVLEWKCPSRGLVVGDQLLQLAEDCGLTRRLGEWVMTRIVHTLLVWRQANLPEMRIAVGLTRRQLGDLPLFERLLEGLRAHDLSPSLVEFGVPADVLSDDKLMVRSVLATLTAFGVGLIIEDFDRGHVAVQTLQNPCLRAVKIDATLVRADKVLAGALIRLSHALSIPVIVSETEGAEPLESLAEIGFDLVEARGDASAVDAQGFADFLRRGAAGAGMAA